MDGYLNYAYSPFNKDIPENINNSRIKGTVNVLRITRPIKHYQLFSLIYLIRNDVEDILKS